MIVRAFVPVGPAKPRYSKMRLLIALIILIYLIGVGVVLSPIVRSGWSSEPASVLADNVVKALPGALAWPARAARSFAR